MFESIQAGKPIEVDELPTLADALGGGIGLDNDFTFEIVRTLIDELILVSVNRKSHRQSVTPIGRKSKSSKVPVPLGFPHYWRTNSFPKDRLWL